MANLSGVIAQLHQERSRAAEELQRLDQAISVLTNVNGGSATTSPNTGSRPRKTFSAPARRRIAAAQRARWAKLKSAKPGSGKVQPSVPQKATLRVLSPAVRNKIAAAQRARWAKVRAQQLNKKKAA